MTRGRQFITSLTRWLTYYSKLANYSQSAALSLWELPIRERESSLRLLSKGWAGFTGQVNHLGKVTKDLWTAVLQQMKWVALLNLSLNKFFLRIVYSVITSCYFTRCKFYHNSCSMVQKCEVDKKQQRLHVKTIWCKSCWQISDKQKSHSETLGLHSLIIENIANWPLSDVVSLLI